MAEGGKEAERRRLAAALRANLRRRKAGAKPAREPAADAGKPGASGPDQDGERG